MQPIKYYAVNESQGFGISKENNSYRIYFLSRTLNPKNEFVYEKLGRSFSQGRDLTFSSPFVADYCVRKDLLPLYVEKK